jgi:hypothetical protein
MDNKQKIHFSDVRVLEFAKYEGLDYYQDLNIGKDVKLHFNATEEKIEVQVNAGKPPVVKIIGIISKDDNETVYKLLSAGHSDIFLAKILWKSDSSSDSDNRIGLSVYLTVKGTSKNKKH